MLKLKYPRRKALRRIPTQHRYRSLHDDRTGIDRFVHEMHSRPRDLYAGSQSLILSIDARKSGEQ